MVDLSIAMLVHQRVYNLMLNQLRKYADSAHMSAARCVYEIQVLFGGFRYVLFFSVIIIWDNPSHLLLFLPKMNSMKKKKNIQQ